MVEELKGAKPLVATKTAVFSLVGFLNALDLILGTTGTVPPGLIPQVANAVVAVGSFIGTLWGRYTAKKKVTGIITTEG